MRKSTWFTGAARTQKRNYSAVLCNILVNSNSFNVNLKGLNLFLESLNAKVSKNIPQGITAHIRAYFHSNGAYKCSDCVLCDYDDYMAN